MITKQEFGRRIKEVKINRRKDVNGAWSISSAYDEQGHEVKAASSPGESWLKCKAALYRRIYSRLAEMWGYYGDVSEFVSK